MNTSSVHETVTELMLSVNLNVIVSWMPVSKNVTETVFMF